MFRFIKILLFIGLITALSILAAEKPGKIIVEWLDFEIISTVPIFIIALLLTILIFKLVVISPLKIINKIFCLKL